jgi:hypothetical protein
LLDSYKDAAYEDDIDEEEYSTLVGEITPQQIKANILPFPN